MEFKQLKRVIPVVKDIAQHLQRFTQKVIKHTNNLLEKGVFSDSAKEAFTDIKAEAASQKEYITKAVSQEAEAVKEPETTQEETIADTTKESKMENPTEGIEEAYKKSASVIVNIAESTNTVLVTTVKVAEGIGSVLLALSNLSSTLGGSAIAAAL